MSHEFGAPPSPPSPYPELFTCCHGTIGGAQNAENHLVYAHDMTSSQAHEIVQRARRENRRGLEEWIAA